MGSYLSAPVTEKDVEDGEDELFKFGTCGMQGWRTEMEDAHVNRLDLGSSEPTAFFAVFDGHGGQEVAKYCARHMVEELVKLDRFKQGDMGAALADSYLRMDELLTMDSTLPELESLMAKSSQGRPQGGGGMEQSLMEIDLDTLPEAIRRAIEDAREHNTLTEGGESDEMQDIILPLEERKHPEYEQKQSFTNGETEDHDDDGTSSTPATSESTEAAIATTEKKQEKLAAPPMHAMETETSDDSDDGDEDDISSKGDKYNGPLAGCTAISAIVRGNALTVANVGDSRCILCRKGQAIAMSEDHKPTNPEEHDRITKAGGYVTDGRVNGSLNLSRAIGDHEFKQSKNLGPDAQIVTAVPEIRSQRLGPGDEFIILACDGIWDILSNQEAVDMVREKLQAGEGPAKICQDICDYCLAPDTQGDGKGCDNMSMMVVVLKKYAGGSS